MIFFCFRHSPPIFSSIHHCSNPIFWPIFTTIHCIYNFPSQTSYFVHMALATNVSRIFLNKCQHCCAFNTNYIKLVFVVVVVNTTLFAIVQSTFLQIAFEICVIVEALTSAIMFQCLSRDQMLVERAKPINIYFVTFGGCVCVMLYFHHWCDILSWWTF